MFSIRSVLAMLLSASSVSASNHYVGGSGTPNDPNIQLAVNAAQPGDVILVASGTHDGFSVTKPLTIAGIDGVTVRGTIPFGWGPPLVAEIASPDLLRLIGIQFISERENSRIAGGSGTKVELEACGFPVRISTPNAPAGRLSVWGFQAFRARACSFGAGVVGQFESGRGWPPRLAIPPLHRRQTLPGSEPSAPS